MTKWFRRKPIDIRPLKSHPELAEINDIVLHILAGRGYTSPEQIKKMLFGGIKDLYDPRKMKDAELATSIIREAIQNGDFITVYGDYDCDGVTSTAVMTMLLEKAGARVGYFTNNRFVHGYGMCPKGVDDLLSLYPETKLIVTVDNGIVAFDGIEYAKQKGIRVVVTDHHEPADTLPNADALVNPKRKDCPYPFKHLCGAGVAFKLMLLLYWEMGLPLQDVYETMDIVALGTVADVVKLEDENRVIVKHGIKAMEEEKRPVFRLLREETQIKEINAHHTLGFIYGPVVNAIGRIQGDPRKAIEMFLTDDETKIRQTIQELIRINNERKKMTEEQTALAEEILLNKGLQFVNVVYRPDFHEGIIGLIAGRLKEKYHRPTFVFTKDANGEIKGSGRSIEKFHLKEALDSIKELLNKYGGHAKACGLSLDEANLSLFESEINRRAHEQLTEDDFEEIVRVEYVFEPKELTIDVVHALRELEPFGEGFPKPQLGIICHVNEVYYMGDECQHLKLRNDYVDLIMWQLADWYKEIGEPQTVKAVGYPELNVWGNNVSIQFIVQNNLLKPA